jgi:hypothetical protein
MERWWPRRTGNMKTWKDVESAIAAYHRDHRHPSKSSLELSGLFDLYPDRPNFSGRLIDGRWPEKWPNADKKGVYIMFDEKMRLLYVGKASMNNTIGSRLCEWFVYDSDRACKPKGVWKTVPRFLATVGFPGETSFEAPGLEEYLIIELNPAENVKGKK